MLIQNQIKAMVVALGALAMAPAVYANLPSDGGTLYTTPLIDDSAGVTPPPMAFGKEYSHEGDVDEAGIPDPLQLINWDGSGGHSDGGDISGLPLVVGGVPMGTFPEAEIDAIAAPVDALFDSVWSGVPRVDPIGPPPMDTTTSLLYSERVPMMAMDPAAGMDTNHIMVQPTLTVSESPVGAESVWAKSTLAGSGEVTSSDLSTHPLSAGEVGGSISTTRNLDGLNMWERTDAVHSGVGISSSGMFSIDGDPGGVNIYATDGVSVVPWLTSAVLAPALETHLEAVLTPFFSVFSLTPDIIPDPENIDVDALMVKRQLSGGNVLAPPETGDRFIFSTDETTLAFDLLDGGGSVIDTGVLSSNGGIVFTGEFTPGGLVLDTFIHGGMLWQGTSMLSGLGSLVGLNGTTFSPIDCTADSCIAPSGMGVPGLPGGMFNIDALEALGVSTEVPEPQTYAILGAFMLVALHAKRRKVKSEA